MKNKLLTLFLALILACTLSCSTTLKETFNNIFGETWEEQTATSLTFANSTVRTACMLQYLNPDMCEKAEKAYQTAWVILEKAIEINEAVESEDRLLILQAVSDLQEIAAQVEELVQEFREADLMPEQFEYLFTVGFDPDIVVAGCFN